MVEVSSTFIFELFRWNMMPSNEQLRSKVDKDTQSQYVYKMINGIKMDRGKDSEVRTYLILCVSQSHIFHKKSIL